MKREKITDTYGGEIEVSHSSAARKPCMWIWTRGGGILASGGTNDGAAHLDLEHARWLYAKLGEFIEHAESEGDKYLGGDRAAH